MQLMRRVWLRVQAHNHLYRVARSPKNNFTLIRRCHHRKKGLVLATKELLAPRPVRPAKTYHYKMPMVQSEPEQAALPTLRRPCSISITIKSWNFARVSMISQFSILIVLCRWNTNGSLRVKRKRYGIPGSWPIWQCTSATPEGSWCSWCCRFVWKSARLVHSFSALSQYGHVLLKVGSTWRMRSMFGNHPWSSGHRIRNWKRTDARRADFQTKAWSAPQIAILCHSFLITPAQRSPWASTRGNQDRSSCCERQNRYLSLLLKENWLLGALRQRRWQ